MGGKIVKVENFINLKHATHKQKVKSSTLKGKGLFPEIIKDLIYPSPDRIGDDFFFLV